MTTNQPDAPLAVFRNRTEIGWFRPSEIAVRLANGELLPTDSVRSGGKLFPLSMVQGSNGSWPEPASSSAADRDRTSQSNSRAKGDASRLYVYEQVKEAIRASVDEFLDRFQYADAPTQGPPSIRLGEFFAMFFSSACVFTDECCQRLVRVIRASSTIPAVRDSATPELAKRIRQTAFKRLDEILTAYDAASRKIQQALTSIRDLQEQRDAKSYREDRKNSDASISPNLQPVESAEEMAQRIDRLNAALPGLRLAAFEKISQYLSAFDTLPEALMAYGCDKCFGADVDWPVVLELEAELRQGMEPKRHRAVQVFDQAGAGEKGQITLRRSEVRMEREAQYLTTVLDKMIEKKVEDRAKKQKEFQYVFVVILCCGALAAIVILWLVLQNPEMLMRLFR